MKQLLVAIAAFAAVATANAYELRLNLGNTHDTASESQAFNYGATFVMSADGGWGAFAQIQPKKEENNSTVIGEWTQIGAIYQVNFFSNNDFKAYMAPGIVATMMKDAADDNVTGFGVGLKTGIQWKASSVFDLGFEHTVATNWTEKKMASTPGDSYALTFGFHF